MNLILCLTEQCNLRCSYCYYKDTQAARHAVMDNATLEQSIRIGLERTHAFGQNILTVSFFGGEPLLRRDAIYHAVGFAKALVAEAIDKGTVGKDFRLEFTINTNGTLFDDEFFDLCEREKFTIFLSLDGPEHHQDIARRTVYDTGSFKAIEKNIPRFVELKATALSTITRAHIDTVAESIKWLHSQGFRSMTTSVDFDGKWTGEDFERLAQQYREMARYWIECRKNGDRFYLGTIQDKVKLLLSGKRYRNYSCHVYSRNLGIATNGNIFPCSRFITSRENAPYKQGNVFTGFDEIACAELHAFLERDKQECEGCDIRHRCSMHECACTSFYTTGHIDGVSAEVCTHERMVAEICDEYITNIAKT